jgi:hypothetical protein
MRRSAPAAAALLLALAGAAHAAAQSQTSCLICHADPEQVGPDLVPIVEQNAHSVHAEVGLSCHDCHGGNPDPALGADAAAMDPDFAPHPFVGAPKRADIPGFCGRCHSDPVFMRRFAPAERVDQEREYWTSHHGRALRKGDPDVPTCVNCHGDHAILRVGDPASPVYPTRVAETCASCHADPKRMRGHRLADGRPLPVDQYALWRRSVHAEALLEREDLSAPTCNDCHGNHAAAPPEVTSIAQVCGNCHGREAQLFQHSPKAAGFERHNEFLASVGEEGCPACHAAPEPQAALTGMHSLAQCGVCHGNHAIVRPTVAMLAPLPDTPCAFCHEGPRPDWEAVYGGEAAAAHYQSVRDQLVASAEAQGLEGDARFDWLVDQARALPFHTLGSGPEGEPRLRPEWVRLFLKFRIGKTHFSYRDPATGAEVSAPITRCTKCHAEHPLLADAPRGLETAAGLLEHMRELTALTATAERTLLRARRGGVATRDAPLEIDHAVDAQVQLEVLVHAFSVEPGGEFAAHFDTGMKHASDALAGARQALAELASRRRGLAVFLGVVVGALVVLALKIRQISARRALEERLPSPD